MQLEAGGLAGPSVDNRPIPMSPTNRPPGESHTRCPNKGKEVPKGFVYEFLRFYKYDLS